MMDFRSGSPGENSGAEEMEVALAKPKHRVVRPGPALGALQSWVPAPPSSRTGVREGRQVRPPEPQGSKSGRTAP